MCTVCDTVRDAPLEETWQLPVAVPTYIPPPPTQPALQTPQSTPSTTISQIPSLALPDLIAHYGGVEKDVNVHCKTCDSTTPHDSSPSYHQTPRILVIQALRFVLPKHPELLTLTTSHQTTTESATATDSSDAPTPTPSTTASVAASIADIPVPSKLRKRHRAAPKRKVIKNAVHITFPLTGLDMTPYLRTPSDSDTEETYDLFGVVEHIGRRMDGGHYIAYVRGRDKQGGDVWWKCNDAKCWIVGTEVVASAQGYIWFYERRVERGRVPTDWPEPVPQQERASNDATPAEKMEVAKGDGGLATPESDERNGGERRAQSEGVLRTKWEGRLRKSSLDGGTTMKEVYS
jgi:hypothetical protein